MLKLEVAKDLAGCARHISGGISNIIDMVDISAIRDTFGSITQNIQNKVSNTVKVVGLAALLGLCSLEVDAQNTVITSFPVSHFQRNHWGNTTPISYEGNNRYRLTSAIEYQTVAMWYIGDGSPGSGRFDLSKDLSFSFTLKFGNGASSPQVQPNIADGFVIVFTRSTPSNTLIGGWADYIGYGYVPGLGSSGIPNALGCEFDSEWNIGTDGHARGDYALNSAHTAFLGSAGPSSISSMTHLNGAHPMQNPIGFPSEWGSVRGKELCCRIEWRQNLDIGGYDLEVYIMEGNYEPWKRLISRNSIHFPTLDSAIPGLSSNPFVSLGITSATCHNPNLHEILFKEISNGVMNFSGTINLGDKSSVDTLYHNPLILSDNLTCDPPTVIFLPDTITNERTICHIGFNILEFLDIDLNGAKFYLKNKNTLDFDSVAGAVNNKFNFTQYLTDTNYLLGRDSNGINYILIKVELANGKILHFKINFRELVLVNHFIGLSDSLSMEIMPGGFNGSMLVTNDILNSIPVPEDCAYEITGYRYDNFIANNYPKYFKETNEIRFILKPNVCREQIIITRNCDDDCPPPVHSEQFSIDIKGADCDCASLPDSLENAEIKQLPTEGCDFTFDAPENYIIHRIVNVEDFVDYDSSAYRFGFKIGCVRDGLLIAHGTGSSYSKTLKVLVKHKETGEICDTLTKIFTCSCPRPPIDKDIVVTNGGFVNVSYTIPKEYTSFVPMRFGLRDNMSNILESSLYTVNHFGPGQFVGQFSFSMDAYPNGIYYIVVEDNAGQILGSEKFVFVK